MVAKKKKVVKKKAKMPNMWTKKAVMNAIIRGGKMMCS